MGRISRLVYVMLGEWAASPLCYPLHRALYRFSGGRIGGRSVGCPVILLTTTGRKSGQPRTAPLVGFPDGRSIVVIPSNAGKKNDPSWYLNLRANPHAQVQIGREIRQVRAREATREERERLWPFIVSQYGGYEVYRERTERQFPVLILEPA